MNNIIFFDFDDTLFSHRTKCISPAVQAALSRLHSANNQIVIASGRGRESEAFIRSALKIEPDYLVLMNGQLIIKGNELVYENFARVSHMKNVMDLAEKLGYPYGGYCSDGILVNNMNSRVEEVWSDFKAAPPVVVPEFQNKHPLYQGHLYITQEESKQFMPLLSEYVINWSHHFLVNLIPKEAGKSQAVYWLMKKLGIERNNSYAFGDGINDCDMLQAVGHGVAMENGAEQLKKIAEYITASVEKDGIVDALEHYGLI